MKNLKFSSLLYGVLFIAFAFGFTSCEDDNTYGDPDTGELPEYRFFITNLAGNQNLAPTIEDSFYNLDYVHIIMHDGKRVEDLSYKYYGESESNRIPITHPAKKGYGFYSGFLADIAFSETHSLDKMPSENAIKYENQPFYLHLSPDDVDTLLFKREVPQDIAEPVYILYHNGNLTSGRNAPIMIRKQGN